MKLPKYPEKLTSVDHLTRDMIVPYYYELIAANLNNTNDDVVRQVNDLILTKFKPSGLLYIKDQAWGRLTRIVGCKGCGTTIAKNELYCGECACEDDCGY